MNLKDLINDPNATLIDVRETWEFSMGHVPGSVNIPLGEVVYKLEELKSMSKPLILFCVSGNRSGQAAAFLKAQGVQNVYNGGVWQEVNQLKHKKAA